MNLQVLVKIPDQMQKNSRIFHRHLLHHLHLPQRPQKSHQNKYMTGPRDPRTVRLSPQTQQRVSNNAERALREHLMKSALHKSFPQILKCCHGYLRPVTGCWQSEQSFSCRRTLSILEKDFPHLAGNLEAACALEFEKCLFSSRSCLNERLQELH